MHFLCHTTKESIWRRKIAFTCYSVWTGFRMKYLRTSFHLALSVISNERRLAIRQAKYVSWLKPNKKTFNIAVLYVCNLCVISITCHFFGHVIASSLTVFFSKCVIAELHCVQVATVQLPLRQFYFLFCWVICAKLTKMLIEHFVHSALKLYAKLRVVKMVRQQTFEYLSTIVISMEIPNPNL